jgi:hypothetical protein
MTTGKKPAHIASKELQSKTSSKSEKSVAGSDLSQARKPHPAPKKPGKR